MDILLGLLIWAVFFVVIGTSIYIGYRLGQRNRRATPIDDETTRKQKELYDGFQRLMNYDIDTAYGKKVSK